MTILSSKRHTLKFHLAIISAFLIFPTLGTAALSIFLKDWNQGYLKLTDYFFAPIFSAGCYFMAFHTVYKYYKNAPNIRVDGHSISFNNKTFSLTEIEHIEFTGKSYFPYIFRFHAESATLIFKDGQTMRIFDDMYANAWELKSYLKQVVIDKKDFIKTEYQNIHLPDLESELFDVYNGNQITSLRGILLWGGIVYFSFLLLEFNMPLYAFIFFLLFSLFWFSLYSWMMYYFKVSSRFLVVKNQNLFWTTNAHRLDDILEIVFETRDKMPNCLRIITKDFKSKLYPAATLREKTWLELKDKLESYGVPVRNECI